MSKYTYWLVLVVFLSGCESGHNDVTLSGDIINLQSPIELEIAGSTHTIGPEGLVDYSRFSVKARRNLEDVSEVSILSHPDGQACYVIGLREPDADSAREPIIRCEDVRRLFTDVTDFTLNNDGVCAADGPRVRCWGRLVVPTFDERGYIGSPSGGDFENPRLLTSMSMYKVCFMDGDQLICSRFSGIDVDVLNAQMQNVTEMIMPYYDVLCYIDDNGVTCVSEDLNKSLVEMAPQNLSDPHGLAGDRYHACVISEGRPHCWGSDSSEVPADITDAQTLVVKGVVACAITTTDVRCWQPPGESGSLASLPEATSAPTSMAFNDFYYACVADIDGVNCGGARADGFASAELYLTQPSKMMFNDYGGCAIENRALVCFGDHFAPQLDVPGAWDTSD